MPLNRMFIFSGNNTGTGILQNIIDSGGVGIICETEADMVSNSIASDYGHWSEVIRCSFDHDPLSYNRRTDREYRELRHSHLSVLISGTPGQVKPLIPSSENGLFSRQMFYYMPRVLHWINQFSLQRTDTSLEFQKLGKDWIAHLREIQKLGVISLRLTDAQIVSFNEVFQTLFERSRKGTGNEMNSSVVRMAINIGRILSIVALLRITGECEEAGDFAASLRKSPGLTPDPQTCSDNIKDGISPAGISSTKRMISSGPFLGRAYVPTRRTHTLVPSRQRGEEPGHGRPRTSLHHLGYGFHLSIPLGRSREAEDTQKHRMQLLATLAETGNRPKGRKTRGL